MDVFPFISLLFMYFMCSRLYLLIPYPILSLSFFSVVVSSSFFICESVSVWLYTICFCFVIY